MPEARSRLPEPFPVLAEALEEVLQGVEVDSADQVEFAQARLANRVGMAPARMRIHLCRLLDGLAARMAELPANHATAATDPGFPEHERLLLTAAGRAQRRQAPASLSLLPERLAPDRQVILAWQAVTAGAGALQATVEQKLAAQGFTDPEARRRQSAAGIVRTIIEHMPPEQVGLLPDTTDEWICVCGNTSDASGFFPCLPNGHVVEPIEGLWVEPLVACAGCYRIIHQHTRQVIGLSAPELMDPAAGDPHHVASSRDQPAEPPLARHDRSPIMSDPARRLPEPFPALAEALEAVLRGERAEPNDRSVLSLDVRLLTRIGPADRMVIHVCCLLDGVATSMAEVRGSLPTATWTIADDHDVDAAISSRGGVDATFEVVTEDTLDVYMQREAVRKARFIAQILGEDSTTSQPSDPKDRQLEALAAIYEQLLLEIVGRAERGEEPASRTLLPAALGHQLQLVLAWQAATAGAAALWAASKRPPQAGGGHPEQPRQSAARIVRTIIEHMPPERIEVLADDWWECLCGNAPDTDGFYPCLPDGRTVEPVEGVWDEPLYVCARCYRIIEQPTGLVVGLSAPERVDL